MYQIPSTAVPRRRGTVTVWVVVCLGVIIGIIALGLDGGRMMEERRHAQAAADAAALAAGDDLYMNYRLNQGCDPGGSAQSAALASAAANGYANDGTSSQVEVHIPPTSGLFAGKAGYVEVIVHSNLPGTFSALFTSGPLPVQARAVARGQPQNIGLLLLGTGDGALSLSGNASVQVVAAGIQSDSTSDAAFQLSGNATVSATFNDFAGSTPPSGNINGTVNTSVPPVADPLLSLPAPSQSACGSPCTSPCAGPCAILQAVSAISVSGNDSLYLQPGVFQGGINVSGNGSLTLAPGVYVLGGGGLQVSGNASITGNGVMIYNTGGGAISITGNGSVTLTPPTSGPYQGISIFQDPTLSTPLQISGNGSVQISGVVYAPAAAVQISGNGSTDNTMGGGFIAASVQISGNGTFTVDHGSNFVRAPDVGLVE